jgi:hypothetical protein
LHRLGPAPTERQKEGSDRVSDSDPDSCHSFRR